MYQEKTDRFYFNLDSDGYLLSVSNTEMPDCPSVESIDEYDLSGCRIGAYRWTGGELVLDEEKLRELEKEDRQARNREKIAELKAQLTATDYAVIKIAEGSATAEEYADVIAQRKAWRAEINELGG